MWLFLKRMTVMKKFNMLLVCLLTVMISLISVGYSALHQSVMVTGDVYYLPNTDSLYDVLKRAAIKGTYATEYTGAHQDSFASTGNKSIYHWYGSDATDGTTTCTQTIANSDQTCSIHYSGKVFSNTGGTAGEHAGNGYAKITKLS